MIESSAKRVIIRMNTTTIAKKMAKSDKKLTIFKESTLRNQENGMKIITQIINVTSQRLRMNESLGTPNPSKSEIKKSPERTTYAQRIPKQCKKVQIAIRRIPRGPKIIYANYKVR